MIPLSDDNPTHSKPYVTIALIALCCLLFVWQLTLGSNGGKAIFALGVIPVSYTHLTLPTTPYV